jgi:RimJ/RimL family protein N-acetyltransferase
LFQEIEPATYQGRRTAVRDCNYFVMGQIYDAKGYRGQGVFAGLYHHMKDGMTPHYDYIVASVSTKNQLSLRAHAKVGFEKDSWIFLVW